MFQLERHRIAGMWSLTAAMESKLTPSFPIEMPRSPDKQYSHAK
ncbi:hypothetical protein PO002_14705 [Cupriavidus necator]